MLGNILKVDLAASVRCSVLSAQWALEPGEGVNIALGTWPPVDSGLVVVAAKY